MRKKMDEVAKGNAKKVCVTGASGYIASWLVKLLLQRGYTVNATVRDPSNPTKAEHLMALEGAKERLHLYKADLMEQGSFDAAVAGCEGVFHTASPVIFSPKNPQADVVDPAVKGTHNVLASCKKFPCVRRVIFTSSMVTMLNSERSKTLAPDVVVDETWFSDPDFCKGSDVMWYVLSKVLAEQSALEFAKENNMDMVVMNPGMVIGSMLQPTVNDSIASIGNLINGSETYPDKAIPWVDVRDVAEAHIRAFEIPSAEGRYIIVDKVIHLSEVLKMLQEIYPSMKLPRKCENADSQFKPCYQVSKIKAKSLGIVEYTPFKVSLKETVESLMEKKVV